MRRLLVLLFLLPILTFADDIYQTHDQDGGVTYTDQPVDGAKKVNLPPIQVYEPQSSESAESQGTHTSAKEATAEPDKIIKYNSININQPADQMTVRDNNGYVLVDVVVEPYLDDTHQLVLLIDGKPFPETKPGKDQQQTFDFSLMNIDRGEHTLVAQIQDSKQQVVLETPPTTFFMRRGPV
jgi:hypothetical protein